jgi:regulator of replication initiation timing
MINEKNIVSSFRKVRNDIIKIQGELIEIQEKQTKIMHMLNDLNLDEKFLEERVANLSSEKKGKKSSSKKSSKGKKK